MESRIKLGLLACVGTLAVTLEGPVPLGLLVLASAAPVLMSPASRGMRIQGTLSVLALVNSLVLSQGLFYGAEPRVPLLELGPLTLYREGIEHGLVQSTRFVAVALAGLALALTTPPDRLLSAMVRMKMPFGLAFLSATALRFVPVVGREIQAVRRARARRGRALWARPPWRWLLIEVAMLRPVIARSLRRARALAESLDARGFDSLGGATLAVPERASWAQILLLGSCALLTLGCVVARILFALYLSELLYYPALRPLYGFVRQHL